MESPSILYTPTQEHLLTTNGWAFLHALRTTRAIDLPDWPSLLEWAAANPGAARQAIRAFANQPARPTAEIAHLADLLLFLDIRPNDTLLVADAQPWPWQAAPEFGTTLLRTTGPASTILEQAATAQATILAVPAPWLDNSSYQRRQRLNLSALRTIITLGAPLSAESAGRIYTWVKSDILLLARAGDRVWGNPLGPVTTKPTATPGLGSVIRR
ncbi:MAG: hypothetical protein EXR09_05120 [Acetobacteraceae bacterium]|nr:hypothetical protein [Acetobacteraceae bacterium]